MHRHTNSDYNKNYSKLPLPELESQCILPLPSKPAKALKESLQSGYPLEDSFSIKIDSDMRHEETEIDQCLLHAKAVDLPTIVESLKTRDNKCFYEIPKICQMIICKEGNEHLTEDESTLKQKKKDVNKVDQTFLWSHGITSLTKNIHRKRFRKMLKKKFVKNPEIEKEVKRSLRVDNDAINTTKWQLICEDDDNTKLIQISNCENVNGKKETNSLSPNVDLAERDIFDEANDSEDEYEIVNIMELDENSCWSTDSRVSDSKDMFPSENIDEQDARTTGENISKVPKIEDFHSEYIVPDDSEVHAINIPKDSLQYRLEILYNDVEEVREKRHLRKAELASTENPKMRQKIQEILEKLSIEETLKMQEIRDLHAVEEYAIKSY